MWALTRRDKGRIKEALPPKVIYFEVILPKQQFLSCSACSYIVRGLFLGCSACSCLFLGCSCCSGLFRLLVITI